MNKVYIACDNGVTGSVAYIQPDGYYDMIHVPVKKCLNYTKNKQWITRIDAVKLSKYLSVFQDENVFVALERPMCNPSRWLATMSAVRAYEATITILDSLKLSYETFDSRLWQKDMLPKKCNKDELKRVSLEVGKRLFSKLDWDVLKFKDADSLLFAEWVRRKGL